MSTLLEQVSRAVPSVYRDQGFHVATAMNLAHIQRRESAFPQPVEMTQSLQFRGDFIGLLQTLGYPESIHHLLTLLNEIPDPLDFDKPLDTLWTYTETEFAKFASEYRSLSR